MSETPAAVPTIDPMVLTWFTQAFSDHLVAGKGDTDDVLSLLTKEDGSPLIQFMARLAILSRPRKFGYGPEARRRNRAYIVAMLAQALDPVVKTEDTYRLSTRIADLLLEIQRAGTTCVGTLTEHFINPVDYDNPAWKDLADPALINDRGDDDSLLLYDPFSDSPSGVQAVEYDYLTIPVNMDIEQLADEFYRQRRRNIWFAEVRAFFVHHPEALNKAGLIAVCRMDGVDDCLLYTEGVEVTADGRLKLFTRDHEATYPAGTVFLTVPDERRTGA